MHHADEKASVVLMDFVVERPLTAFPGGDPALLRTLGEMVARLQATAPFPPVMEDFGALVEVMLNLVRDGELRHRPHRFERNRRVHGATLPHRRERVRHARSRSSGSSP